MGPRFAHLPSHGRHKIKHIVADLDSKPDLESFPVHALPYRVAPEESELIQSRLLLYLIRDVLGCADLGRSEKVLYRCPLIFKSIPMMIVHEKFGLRVYVSNDGVNGQSQAEEVVAGLFKRLRSAMRIVEKHLLVPLIAQQEDKGNITIENRYLWFRDMYDYFRKKSEHYADNANNKVAKFDNSKDFKGSFEAYIRDHNCKVNLGLKSAYFASAGILAYFSALEHLLVVALAVTDFQPSAEKLSKFVGNRWADKFRRVADISVDADAKRCYDILYYIAEKVRNPNAHGGFDHQQSLFHMHLPGIGAVPARLSQANEDFRFDLSLSLKLMKKSNWDLLDDVDHWLRSGSLRFATMLAESGLHVAFDARSRKELSDATNSRRAFRQYLDALSYETDRAANMDW